MATMWRNHKYELYNDYIFGKKKGRVPCIDYEHITPEKWQEFLEQREDEVYKKHRDTNIEAAKQNKYSHTLLHGGYELLERQMIQERLVVLRATIEAEGQDTSSNSIDQVHINLGEKWKESKKSKGTGKYMTEESRVGGERIVSIFNIIN